MTLGLRFKRWKYCRRTFALAANLIGQPRRELSKSFPDLRSAVRLHFADKVSEEESATLIAGTILTHAIESPDMAARRELIALQLREMQTEGRILTGSPDAFHKTLEYMDEVIMGWIANGKVDDAVADMCFSEIVGAIQGLDRDARLERRVNNILKAHQIPQT